FCSVFTCVSFDICYPPSEVISVRGFPVPGHRKIFADLSVISTTKSTSTKQGKWTVIGVELPSGRSISDFHRKIWPELRCITPCPPFTLPVSFPFLLLKQDPWGLDNYESLMLKIKA
ncbi:MAG: hypothetical protein M0P38_07985, partial [Bacteroidales bacterium]|nr:hypothetical protein [Bacteroidales bacterium]